jgi:Double zinc ribbon/FHA domain
MPMCRVCGEEMPDRARTCKECGSALPEFAPAPSAPKRAVKKKPPPPPRPKKVPPGVRVCPSCEMEYDTDYTDAFCICGAELEVAPAKTAAAPPEMPPPVQPRPRKKKRRTEIRSAKAPEPAIAPGVEAPAPRALDRPPPGTRCLVLYGPDRNPMRWFPLAKDATLIGRLDAPAGNFPDIDVDEWLDAATARRLSRQHALVLRSRVTGDFTLRPLPGNTGTQVEAEMVVPMQDHALAPGQRLILGGVARFKFEIA